MAIVPRGFAVSRSVPDGIDVACGRDSFAPVPWQAPAVSWQSDLVPSPGPPCCWPRCSRVDRSPVGDAIALGTLGARLETRTKESSMCASHWDVRNPKAK